MFLLATWDVNSQMSAHILDLHEARHAGSLTASGRGRSNLLFLQVLLVVVLPVGGNPSFPEPVACSKLGEGVAEALLGNKSSENKELAR